MEYFRHGPYLDVEFEDDPPSGAKHVKAELLNGVEDMLSFTSAELNGRLSAGELSATYATNEYVGTLAYGTDLEATDATVATWIGDESTATGAKASNEFVHRGEQVYFAWDFGLVGDGVADDTEAMRSFVEFLNTNGGRGVAWGTYLLTGNIRAVGGTGKPFEIDGGGVTTFLFRATTGNMAMEMFQCKNVTWKNFNVDAGYSVTGNSHHVIVGVNCEDVRVENIHVKDWLNSGIIFYYSNTLTGVSKRNHMIYCSGDGMGAANNGFLLEKTDGGSMLNCRVVNLSLDGDPSYGLQLKNGSTNCHIIGGYVEGAIAAVAFGQQGGVGASSNTVTGVIARRVKHLFIAGYAHDNTVDVRGDLLNDAITNDAVQMADSNNNTVRVEVKGMPSTVPVVDLQNSHDNAITVAHIDSIGYRMLDNRGGLRNIVTVGQVVGGSVTDPFTGSIQGDPSNQMVYVRKRNTAAIGSAFVAQATPPPAVNLTPNASFETDVAGVDAPIDLAVAQTEGAGVADGTKALSVTVETEGSNFLYVLQDIAVTEGQWVSFAANTRLGSGSEYARHNIIWVGSTRHEGAPFQLSSMDGGSRNAVTAQVPAGVTAARVGTYFYSDSAGSIGPVAGSTYQSDAWAACMAATKQDAADAAWGYFNGGATDYRRQLWVDTANGNKLKFYNTATGTWEATT